METAKLRQACDMADTMALGAWLDLMNTTIAAQPEPEKAKAYCIEYNGKRYEAKKLASYGYNVA